MVRPARSPGGRSVENPEPDRAAAPDGDRAIPPAAGSALPPSHWVAWHDAYDDPSSPLSARLATVQSHIEEALDRAPAGEVRVVSICAGQGRDLVGVLAGHRRRTEVRARLVEAD